MNKDLQITDKIVMIRPDYFGFNPETAKTNYFQGRPRFAIRQVRRQAISEFNEMVNVLLSEGINVYVLPSRKNTNTPDAVFPNNWFSSHTGGLLVIYPMLTDNRRRERQTSKLKALLLKKDIKISKVIDLTKNEKKGLILEGTGSLILDRVNKIAFTMESPRATKILFEEWCSRMGYKGVFFHAFDENNMPIYHTNVLMSIGDGFAVYCEEAIRDKTEKDRLRYEFRKLKKEVITISLKQMGFFCGNILQVKSTDGKPKIVMSKKAHDSFSNLQREKLKKYGKLVSVPIPTIESIGGGSARCMMAEVFS